MRIIIIIALIILAVLIGYCVIYPPTSILDDYYSDDVYQSHANEYYAFATNDSSYCNAGDAYCFEELAKSQKSYDLCKKPVRDVDKEFCRYEVSVTLNDPQACLNLTNLDYYYQCIVNNAKLAGNESYCDLMEVKDESYPYQKKHCINEAIFGKKDVKECARINDGNSGWTQNDYIRACITNAQTAHATPESCEKGTSGLSDDDCWIAVAEKQPRNSTYCSKVTFEPYLENCYLNTIDRNGYFCDNPPPEAIKFCQADTYWLKTSNCEKIPDKENKDRCFLRLAKETQDAQKCQSISNPTISSDCKRDVAGISKVQKKCDAMQGKDRDLCYLQNALKYAQSFCKKISFEAGRQICRTYSPMRVVHGR
ncbi:MAG: hypothetical protein EPN86_05010 [Nanoarchaeota archaeon]|nr:MAG: hypothetical protein EPN86_05010 [Nanoarchaeota archaeon]